MLILLVGPKGAGKTHIGRLLETHLGVHFFHVEPHWKSLMGSGRVSCIAEGIEQIHPLIAEALQRGGHVCVETTGASPEILGDLVALGERVGLLLVNVRAPLDVCLERISARDQTHQIPLDEAGIREVYRLGDELDLKFDLVVENVGLTDEGLLRMLRPLVP